MEVDSVWLINGKLFTIVNMKVRHYYSIILFFVFSLMFNISISAQTGITDSVFLTNGNIVIGRIKNYVPNQYLKIETTNGMFFFITNDISKLAIHTKNLNDLISTENLQKKENVVLSDDSDNDVHNKTQHTDNKKLSPEKHSKLNDYLPINLFFVQSSLEISSISSPFTVDGQAKFQVIYSRRSIADYAFGLGACLRYVDFDSFAKVLFIDIRTIRAKENSFTSFSLDPGIVFYNSNAGLNLNIAFNYGKRIQKNLFFTMGIDINYQSNTYGSNKRFLSSSGSINPGINIGLMF